MQSTTNRWFSTFMLVPGRVKKLKGSNTKTTIWSIHCPPNSASKLLCVATATRHRAGPQRPVRPNSKASRCVGARCVNRSLRGSPGGVAETFTPLWPGIVWGHLRVLAGSPSSTLFRSGFTNGPGNLSRSPQHQQIPSFEDHTPGSHRRGSLGLQANRVPLGKTAFLPQHVAGSVYCCGQQKVQPKSPQTEKSRIRLLVTMLMSKKARAQSLAPQRLARLQHIV